MLDNFRNLPAEHLETLKHSVSWITVLIAGADGELETKELAWAEKIAKIRTYAAEDQILDFFRAVGVDYSEVLAATVESSSKDKTERTQQLSEKLSQLNEVFPLLERNYAIVLYNSLLSFAKHVAKSSGGFLGFMTIDSEESKLIELPMINRIG